MLERCAIQCFLISTVSNSRLGIIVEMLLQNEAKFIFHKTACTKFAVLHNGTSLEIVSFV